MSVSTRFNRTGNVDRDLRGLEAVLHNFVRVEGGLYLPGSFLELEEQSDPDAPATDHARLFSRDSGAGKTQLCVRFATGAVQVIATEP